MKTSAAPAGGVTRGAAERAAVLRGPAMRAAAKKVAVTIALAAVLMVTPALGGCGAQVPETTSEAGYELFDSTVLHEIAVSFDQAEYDAMVESYSSTGEKEWIEATVTIDGVTYEKVGVRLKGNSSIMALQANGGPGGGPVGMPGAGVGDDTGIAGDLAARAVPGGFGAPPAPGGVGGPGGDASSNEPEGLPWLIRLDKYLAGQSHDGIVDLVVRSNTSETSLNEAVALDLLESAGLASQDAIAARFTVNDSDAVLRLVIENPDDVWLGDNFAADGALYKAESTGNYSYRGDDPASYTDVFDQEAGEANADLTPLIDFLAFINDSNDATFQVRLAEHLDIDAFVTYLAMEELLDNFDDIDGPGNNSYLYYDPETDRFTVVPWDHNLAFGALGDGGGFPGQGQGGVPSAPTADGLGAVPPGADLDTERPAGGPPQGPPPAAMPEGGVAAGLPGAGGPGSVEPNVLVERFLAVSAFEELIQARLAELTQELYESGVATDILDRWVTLLQTDASDVVDPATVEREAAKIAEYFKTGE